MKKIVALILLACMAFSLAACGGSPAAPAEVEYQLGMGVDLSTASSKTGNAQVDATVAVVAMADGKIVACRIDCAQSKMAIEDGAVDAGKTFMTKMELGENYGMVAYGNAIAEWDAQAKAFEEYVVGKTADEVAGIETAVNESGHNVSTDEALLAGCTMDISSFKTAVAKACNDAKGESFKTAGSFTLGVAAITTADESVAATAEEDGTVKMYTDFAGVAVDGEGKVLAMVTDAVQPKITITAAGEIADSSFGGTKKELGDNYNMVAYGNAIAEWDAQAAAFEQYVVGKSADEIRGLDTVVNESGHNVSTDEALLAGCTIDISGFMAVTGLAMDYAR